VIFIIKYLHSCARFVLKNSARSFSMSNSSTKFVKSVSNIKITRIFCDIIKNSTKNKKWKKEHHKIVVKNFAFFLFLDKKSSSNMNIEQKNSKNVFYHYTNSFDSRINHNKVWFIETLNISKKRFRKAQKTVKTYMQWKMQLFKEYEKDCRIYLKNRIAWKYHLMQQVLDISDLIWSIDYSKKKILRIAHSIKIILLIDIQKVVKKNDFF
jgi:hypothetical protein